MNEATARTLEQLRSGALAGATRIDLSGGLTELPPELFALGDTLEALNLSGNALADLPDDLARLRRLRIVFCSDNRFTHVPKVLGTLPALEMVGFKSNRIRELSGASLPPRLRWLILTANELADLPDELGRRPRLQKLMLAGNRLSKLPPSMAACERLELLRIASNRFEELPDWLLELPRLSWLAFAGNPVAEASEDRAVQSHPVPDIPWQALQLHEVLGQGASGVIHRASWQGQREVAVKLFKGEITSDGSPLSEMDACIAAGAHPALIAVRGRIAGHPAGTPGLVLDLVDPRFRNLAGPPSFESCTRDVYEPALQFEGAGVLAMAGGIASAVAQLHARGILHGDLYGHNILWDGRQQALLGDFGAASFFAPGSAQGQGLMRIEARAFGCLLEELVERCGDLTADQREGLLRLQSRCLDADPRQRPGFDEIAGSLQTLQP
ncbi:leucine-rich repeat-containing protein kinase family protein [Variovorax sp. OV329]|uniref:leucine-rich repeat-containing protein kinase family protein n=1 Tax=Variovorax sp. OV329 TaxID=1882825 RepID=UPI0008E0F2E4|nr:leucine-rich repeat-containing protein kinase family protein [Variovorax sp. OV329]SFN25321.1 Leucine rich repeat-containing protein [Variovorax sp. OV329]